ncbi:phospho-sugar mutase [Parachlamydia sp. AcF125]|uniref:phospho-sugar mutase n=1 Tax=Parachlamydia sp. AcF125 TaxID=2795736 RepID=UPI001BCA453B|nr:phospho-sugar mutase [Parachlamydia sp. AcF125]MBS4169022.1 Phosphoglucomutase [Parachlamydia sp. AcF125]
MTQFNEKIALDPIAQTNVNRWLEEAYDEETKQAIRHLLEENPEEIVDAFYTTLSFGTGGLRGIMGIGTNRMNPYTVRAASQGVANYLLQQKDGQEKTVFVGYDSRHSSQLFAEETAKVFAGNGIKAYLCKHLRPTPYVSFGCRYKKCQAAVMVTASHNPPEYNGYKVYWSDGGQVLPPHDKAIMAEVNKIVDLSMIRQVKSLEHPLIERVEEEIDQAYLKAIESLQMYSEENKVHGKELRIVYTSLHGTGISLMPQAFKQWGFETIHYVKDQILADGNFPTVHYPNPEEPEALSMGIDLLKQQNADLLIATDPDADRVGVAVKHGGTIHILTGNQVACICLAHICEALTQKKQMPERAAFIKTIVTTELFKSIVEAYHKTCFNVLPGFKYIAQHIHEWEQEKNGYQYVFGGEESCGYLFGTQARDKDALLSSLLVCEAALHAKKNNQTLVDLLNSLYQKHGFYLEKLLSLQFEETKLDKERMAKGMQKLRASPPTSIGGVEVIRIEDFQTSIKTELKTGKQEFIGLPKSNVLLFWLEDGSKIIARPSGTEPKIKLYCGVKRKGFHSIEEVAQAASQYADQLLSEIQNILKS